VDYASIMSSTHSRQFLAYLFHDTHLVSRLNAHRLEADVDNIWLMDKPMNQC